MYDFDTVISRRHTDSMKWDGGHNKDEDMIKMWVADMDFKVLPDITEALHEKIEEGIYGYSMVPESYYEAVGNWMKRRHDFHVEKEWMVLTSGVVNAINLAVRAYSEIDDHIMILTPVYYPFKSAIVNNKRKAVSLSLDFKEDHYELDFDLFEKKIIEDNVKMLIFCNPHNPVGKVWTKEELLKIGEICLKHHVIVVSDEIHMDFVYGERKHIPFYEADPRFKDISIVATAASKTFNLAGLQTSTIFIANKELRELFKKEQLATGMFTPNVLGLIATMTAYEKGDDWVDEMLSYVEGNINYMESFLKKNLPEVKMIRPEGLYLVWVDFRNWHMSGKELERFMLKEAKLWLDEGYIFGEEGEGFERFNLACPRAILEKALNRITVSVSK